MVGQDINFVDDTNLDFYEDHFSQEGLIHRYPNVNTVRCELWYFRKNKAPGKILDYGFGYGQESIYFAENGYDVYGIDISKAAKKRFEGIIEKERPELKEKIRTTILNPDDGKLPYDDDYFDFIHSNQVIYHLPNEEAIRNLIKEWYRVLKPSGLLMFSTVGPECTCVKGGVEIEKNLFEKDYSTPLMDKPVKLRSYLMKDEESIIEICKPFTVDEVGWFTNHYCGVDGFHWQVLAKK